MFKDRLGVEDSHVARKGGGMDRMEEGRVGRGRNVTFGPGRDERRLRGLSWFLVNT